MPKYTRTGLDIVDEVALNELHCKLDMNIIGHRGAKSIAPENTLSSIKKAIRLGVDAVEFDIRVSKDGVLYLCHDASLLRTYDVDKKISDLTSSQLSKIKDSDGNKVPSLDDALTVCGDTPAVIECKSGDWVNPLVKVLKNHSKQHIHSVISFNHAELAAFSKLLPNIPTYALEHRNPFDAINAARMYGFDGIDINYWTLNPLAYFLAWRHKLKIIVFTVNKRWVAKFLSILYPGIGITTDVPQIMQHVRSKKASK